MLLLLNEGEALHSGVLHCDVAEEGTGAFNTVSSELSSAQATINAELKAATNEADAFNHFFERITTTT